MRGRRPNHGVKNNIRDASNHATSETKSKRTNHGQKTKEQLRETNKTRRAEGHPEGNRVGSDVGRVVIVGLDLSEEATKHVSLAGFR